MSGEGYWFISHCSKDIKIVEQIVNILEYCGISYWKAPEMIPAGSNYAREIPKALKNCSIFLFVVSKASQNSIWVEKEVDIAINSRKKIIPVKIDGVPLNDMYRFYLNNIQTIDVFIQSNGKIPRDVQKRLESKFMENMTSNRNSVKKAPLIITEAPRISSPNTDPRVNAFRVNKIPMQCEQCGTALEHIGFGTYKCVKCNIEYYDDFQKIRNFLKENGPAPAIVIARKAGVSKQAVECYFNDDLSVHYSNTDYARLRLTRQ